MITDNRSERIAIENLKPEIDGGRFPVKRAVGERVVVEADIFADGHDQLCCAVLFRGGKDESWSEARMERLSNDRWRGSFKVEELGRYQYTVMAWVDKFSSWKWGLAKKVEAGQDVSMDLLVGAELIEKTIDQAPSPAAETLNQ